MSGAGQVELAHGVTPEAARQEGLGRIDMDLELSADPRGGSLGRQSGAQLRSDERREARLPILLLAHVCGQLVQALFRIETPQPGGVVVPRHRRASVQPIVRVADVAVERRGHSPVPGVLVGAIAGQAILGPLLSHEGSRRHDTVRQAELGCEPGCVGHVATADDGVVMGRRRSSEADDQHR